MFTKDFVQFIKKYIATCGEVSVANALSDKNNIIALLDAYTYYGNLSSCKESAVYKLFHNSVKKTHDDIHKLYEKVTIQMNDTHPTVAVAELMRILVDEEERAVVLTAADGFYEGLFQILGNDYLLWIHLLGFSRRVGINGCKGKKKTAKCKEKSEKNAIALNFFPLTASKGQIFVKNQ